MQSLEIDPKVLVPNPWNSNHVSPDNMDKLKRSIKDLGFASAVVVRELPDGTLEILGGKHRTEAAIELGLKKVPVVNLGALDDRKAKKIGLVDNHRYGNDDVLALAKIFEEIGEDAATLTNFLPVGQADIEAVIGSVDFDLDAFDMDIPEDEDEEDDGPAPERKAKTHDVLKFRINVADAERIRQLIERTMKDEKLDASDDMTNAGDALAFLLLKDD